MSSKLLSSSSGAKNPSTNLRFPGKPITEIVTNGFFTVDNRWTVIYWNKAAEKLLGVNAKDIVGKNLWEEFAGVLPLDFYTIYHKAFLQDIPIHFEEYWGEMGAWFDVITYHCDDTLSVSFKSSNFPGHPTLPRNSGQQLKILNELYRFVTVVTNDCLWEWNLKTRELFWIDGGHKRAFGYPIENALIPQSFWENHLHPDDKERILGRLNKIISERSESVWEDEYRFKKINGDYAYVHDRGHIIYDDDKVASRMIGATQDISVRKLTEIQLLESERKLSLIAKETVNAVIITDAEGKITWVNSAFTRISEYEQDEVIGKKPGSFLQGKETDSLTVLQLKQKILGKEPFDCEIINYSKSGRKYWARIQGQPLLDQNGIFERYFAIATDITEKVLLENKLIQEKLTKQKEIAQAVLIAQEKERDDIGKELHDNLNQVLGAAKLYIEMARTDEKNRDMCLEKSSEYIVTVIEDIRKISKTLATPGMRTIGLLDSIKILLADLIMIHPVKIEFAQEGINEEELDKKLQLDIFRIVQEQVNNILKHAYATNAKIMLTKKADEIILVISDNGVGCDTSNLKMGTGIQNIKGRAQFYGGKIRIVSKPEEGYRLKVVIPLSVTNESLHISQF